MHHDLDHFEKIARATIASLPRAFRPAADNVILRIAEWPAPAMLDELGFADPYELTGLYEGIPMTEKSVPDLAPSPDVVWLFRQPILAEWRDRGDVELNQLIAHVVVHEFAHHFGWTDEEIAATDQWWV
ncbi:metallopeptidase family protein [Leisingera caerulea]|uniref:Metallopeptidase family protein n=1 Tax=Leisingera caerulea TaxID=506591 RepID=A0ABY5WUH3_LEICA|nr:metallopeptidase family protein [Leisingera caerulea]UWQ57773.1 metallopeptidase family protein [Leisingera caerulea]